LLRCVDRRQCCQLRFTDDRRQFITLSVLLPVHNAARRAGPSAAAETCTAVHSTCTYDLPYVHVAFRCYLRALPILVEIDFVVERSLAVAPAAEERELEEMIYGEV